MTLTEAILSLHPSARFGADFIVSQSHNGTTHMVGGEEILDVSTITATGPDEVTFWNAGTLGARDDAAIAAAVAKAAPTPARLATSYDLVSVLTDDEVAALGKAKAKDQHLFGKRDTPFPEDNPKVARFAALLNTNAKAWFDRVSAPAS